MDQPIELLNSDDHFGNTLGHNLNKQQIQDIYQFIGKTNMVISHFCKVPFDIAYHIFKTYCMPLCGSQLWGYSHKSITTFMSLGGRSSENYFVCRTIPTVLFYNI